MKFLRTVKGITPFRGLVLLGSTGALWRLSLNIPLKLCVWPESGVAEVSTLCWLAPLPQVVHPTRICRIGMPAKMKDSLVLVITASSMFLMPPLSISFTCCHIKPMGRITCEGDNNRRSIWSIPRAFSPAPFRGSHEPHCVCISADQS